nr:hypothetical protein [Tanacetum cinerariifolium]
MSLDPDFEQSLQSRVRSCPVLTVSCGICSPDGKDEEMYYGQLQEILEFSYLSFKLVLFRVKCLNDLDNTTLHIDGQSTEVDAVPDIIDLDEDNDIIDDEDTLPYDLADYDDDGVDVVYSSEEEDCS